jgi:vancomycin resistance protein YoaR
MRDEIDLVDDIQREGPAGASTPARIDLPDSPTAGARWLADPTHSTPPPRMRALGAPQSRPADRARLALGIAIAFALGSIAVLLLFMVAATVVSASNAGRVLPGVRVGSVDVSGLTRQEAVSRLQASYAYLSQGDVEIETPKGASTVTYEKLGRGPDVQFMADEAMRVGRTGEGFGDALTVWRSSIGGQTVPVAISIDPTAVADHVRAMSLTSLLPSRDAEATLFDGTFIYWPSAAGSAVDEDAVGASIVEHLTEPSTVAHFQVGAALVTLQPRVGDDDAKAAIAAAGRMTVDVTLTLGAAGSPSPVPSSSGTPAPARTYVIPAAKIRGWIVFGQDASGKYGPSLDLGLVEAYVRALPKTTIVAPVEPRVVFDASGVPVSLAGGQDGLGVDSAATAQAIDAYLLRLAEGGSKEPSIALVIGPITPRVTVGNLTNLTIIGAGKGAWTTIFFPGVSNGNGANIRTPALLLNGQIVAPGQQFSFMRAVGPIDEGHGYTLGGVIQGGKSDHTGAMGGGICSASTTMFNAAARAGLQIDERHAHYYYIDRYPVGLDATVYSNGYQVWDLKWTNDTPNPIVIRAWTAGRSKSSITIQLWSLPLDRTVTFSPEVKANVVKAGDQTVYVNTLAPGEKNRAEYPTDGYDTVRTRTVTDATGGVIHSDTWKSHYTKVDGLLEIGGSAPPTPTPTTIFALPALAFLRAASAVTRRKRRA